MNKKGFCSPVGKTIRVGGFLHDFFRDVTVFCEDDFRWKSWDRFFFGPAVRVRGTGSSPTEDEDEEQANDDDEEYVSQSQKPSVRGVYGVPSIPQMQTESMR
jgi:hypothetical protein